MGASRPLSIAIGVTALAAALSYALGEWSATGVGLTFCLATYLTVLRKDSATIVHHGLALGGLFDPVPLDARRLARDGLRALGFAALAALVFFPPYVAVAVWAWAPHAGLRFELPTSVLPTLATLPGQVLAVAVPEEMFYRGYAQTALDDAYGRKARVLGAELGLGVLASSAVFALGHFATTLHPARLLVFFPSLAFGWLRARTGGIGAAVAFHAACNLLSFHLAEGYQVR